jgi:hypothetical protein
MPDEPIELPPSLDDVAAEVMRRDAARAAEPRFPALWYTSNSPISRGQRDCGMRRYGEYHAGVHGSGYRRKAGVIPLATGKSVHQGLQLLGEWIMEWQTGNPAQRLVAVDQDAVAWAASEAAAKYEIRARSKGLQLSTTDSTTNVAMEQLILEQRTLVEALVWIYALVRLPYMLSQYRLLNVEYEEGPVLDCSCGLGDWVGTPPDHGARGCLGVVAQGRTDYLWEGMALDVAGQLAYEEFKTKASQRKSWEDAWEHAAQLWLNMEAASRRLGKPVDTAFVPVLYKGWRGRDKGAPETDPKYQHSPLCYGWFDPGNPPMRPPAWSSTYKWFDEMGAGHTLPRTYTRQPIWNEALPLPALPDRPDASRVERWVKSCIKPAQYMDLMTVLGPFPRPAYRLEDASHALLAEERKWRQDVEYLRSVHAYEISHPAVVDLIPRSWNCTGYDGTRCEFYPVCKKEPGWDQPLSQHPLYELRTPHHVPERQAFEALGVVFPGEGDEDEDGEE